MFSAIYPCFQCSLYNAARTGQARPVSSSGIHANENCCSLFNFKALFCPTFSNVAVNLKPERNFKLVSENSWVVCGEIYFYM